MRMKSTDFARNWLWVIGLAALGAMAWVVFGPTGSQNLRPLLVEAQPIDPNGVGISGSREIHLPKPTEVVADRDARKERKRERQEWYESLHLAPPDVDWQQIEEENRRALSLERFGRIEQGDRTRSWTELGSVNLAGRTHAACPSPDGQRLYVGSNLGGVWRGTIDGQDWQALSDGLGQGSHQLLVAPGPQAGDPETILTLYNSGSVHAVYASTDDGQTWFVPEGMPLYLYEATRLVQDHSQPGLVYLLSRGGQYNQQGGFEYGFIVSRSLDGGSTFELRSILPMTPRCDLWLDRVDGGDLYLMAGNTLKVSQDQGETWQDRGSAPQTTANKVILTGSEAGAPTLYAALYDGTNWKLHRSTDAGATWAWRFNISDFWETMVASITNPNLVFVAGVECWRSANGGSSFTKVNAWGDYYQDPENKLHADLPGMNVHWIDDQEAIYFNTDGGTYVSHDGGLTVQNLSLWGLAVSQYYSIFTSQTDPYLILGGSQDQGYQQSLPALRGDRNGYLPFDQLISGDYGHITSTVRDHNWVYSVYPGFVLLQKREISPQFLFTLDFPSCDHSWMPPILSDPDNSDVFYFCGDHLWKYERQGTGYVYAVTELPQDFAAGGGYLSGLAISPADPNYWYAVTSTGMMWYSHDRGLSWTQAGHGPFQHYFYGTALAASPNDRNLCYVGGSGYAGSPVWRTTDGGLTWEAMGTGLPNTLVLGLALGGESGQDLFAATQAGPYGYSTSGGQWEGLLGTEAPLTTYWCLEWVPEIGVVRFGTYGRGIWDYTPPGSADVDDLAGEAGRNRLDLRVQPNPIGDQLTLRFRLDQASEIRLELFDVTGRTVGPIVSGRYEAGEHSVRMDDAAAGLEAGVYFARLATPLGTAVRKVLKVE